jgi:hypothetical protein
MSTTLLIGRWPAAISRALTHGGDDPIVTRAQLRVLDVDPHAGHRGRAGIEVRPLGRRQRRVGGRVDLARDAVDTQAVGPVGRDLQLEHVGGDREHIGQRRAGREGLREHHDPVVVGADRQLVLGEDHAVGLDAAQLGPLELGPVGHHRAGESDGHRLAVRHVGRAANDLARLAVADVDHADAEAIGVRVALGGEHAADDEVLQRGHAVRVDALDLGAGHRQALGELVRRQPGVAVGVQPLDRKSHPYCSSIRRSLS